MYYQIASVQNFLGVDSRDNIRKYLELCAKDDRKRPAAYYHLASLLITEKSSFEEIEALYLQGIEAEKDQLPLFT